MRWPDYPALRTALIQTNWLINITSDSLNIMPVSEQLLSKTGKNWWRYFNLFRKIGNSCGNLILTKRVVPL